MKLQASNKTLLIAVVALALINLVSLGIMWFDRNHNRDDLPGNGNARDFLVEILHLDQEQSTSFDRLREQHFTAISTYNQDLKRLKDSLFEQLHTNNDSLAKNIASKIGDCQTKIELQTFAHFSALRALLSDGQKKDFDRVIGDVLKNLHPSGPGNRHRRPPHNLPPPE